jgi:hypothetical protein
MPNLDIRRPPPDRRTIAANFTAYRNARYPFAQQPEV